MSNYVLITSNVCWADEFDVHGFDVISAEFWEELKKAAEKFITENPDYEFYFGTNEAVQFYSYDEFISSYEVKPLEDAEYATLVKLFGRSWRGEKSKWKASFGDTFLSNIWDAANGNY